MWLPGWDGVVRNFCCHLYGSGDLSMEDTGLTFNCLTPSSGVWTVKKKTVGGFHWRLEWVKNTTQSLWDWGFNSWPWLSGLRIQYCCKPCSVGCRCGSDLALLWLWCRRGSCSSDLTPSLGTSICCKCGPKKTSQRTNKHTKLTSGSLHHQKHLGFYSSESNWAE